MDVIQIDVIHRYIDITRHDVIFNIGYLNTKLAAYGSCFPQALGSHGIGKFHQNKLTHRLASTSGFFIAGSRLTGKDIYKCFRRGPLSYETEMEI